MTRLRESIVFSKSFPIAQDFWKTLYIDLNTMKRAYHTLLTKFAKLGPAAIPAYLVISGLCILTFFRAALTLYYSERVLSVPGFWQLFVIGVRMDLILLSYAAALPTLLLFFLPAPVLKRMTSFFSGYVAIFLTLVVYLEIATFPFIDEYDLRPDQKFLEYLNHFVEVCTTLVKVYARELVGAAVIVVIALRHFWKSTQVIQHTIEHGSYVKKLLVAPFVIGVLVLGARSSLGHRPANLSTALFSENHLANELALNSTYTTAYAAYRMYRYEENPSLMYGEMKDEEVLSRVRATALNPEEYITPSEIPLLRKQRSPFKRSKPPNVVIILEESMGAVDVGCLKGPPVTPNLCRLKDEGLWLSNLYATGTRTVRGIEAVVSSFLPTAARGVVKLELAKKRFFTAGALFKSHGYATSFIYGGMSNFDEMKVFFSGNGFETIYDEPTFENPVMHGTWGVSDEDLFRKAHEVFKSQGDKPFFSLILTTSNHLPYEFPDGRIELYEQPKQTHFNAIKYTDYALGLFMDLAKSAPYYEDTIFLVVADHNSHVKGNDLIPISKFHIPALLIGPNVPRKEFDRLASQIDLLPTLLHFSGLETVHPMVGRNLMELPETTQGRAFMQYGNNNAYRVEDEVIVLTPFNEPLKFNYRDDKMVSDPIDTPREEALARDALAYATLPWIVYANKLYRVP